MSYSPTELAAKINARLTGLDRTLVLELLSVTAERIEAELQIDDRHRQVHGVVHGGVYASIVETLGSVGPFVALGSERRAVVGMENHTSFLRAVSSGKLHAVAFPIHRGRRSQLWEIRIESEDGELAATGRLRTLCLEEGAKLAGTEASPVGLFDDESAKTAEQ